MPEKDTMLRGGANFNSDYRSEKQKLRESGLRGRELRQTARRNIMGNAISKSADLENTLDQNIDQIGNETDAYINNDIHRAIVQGRQERWDLLDQFTGEPESLKGLVKPVQIQSAPVVPQQEEPDYDSMSFKNAFATARKNLGAGKVFTWKGGQYTTNYGKTEPQQTIVVKSTLQQVAGETPQKIEGSHVRTGAYRGGIGHNPGGMW